MTENSPSASLKPKKWPWRHPPTACGIQVNHCKNPLCANLGVEPAARKRGRLPVGEVRNEGVGDYIVVTTHGRTALKCLLCNETFPMQSNLAVAEELQRIGDYLEPEAPVCQNGDCELFGDSSLSATSSHTLYGTNRHGTPRYKCGGCTKIFAQGGKPTKRQRDTHLNRQIFAHLMNTVPIRRTMKLLKISASVLYARLDFIHRQCILFVSARERTLVERLDLGKRYISVDRQKLLVNWSSRKNRRNTIMLSIASADQVAGYVYGAHLNYDPAMDEDEVLKDLPRFGDDKLDAPFRRYARLWLEADYQKAATRAAAKPRSATAHKKDGAAQERLSATVKARYERAGEREDIEGGDEPSLDTRPPASGMLLHEQVVMHAHIQLVSRLLRRADKLRFFVDQEPGIRAAIMAAMPERIKNRTADAFYVTVAKDVTIDQKRTLVNQSIKDFKQACADNPALTDEEVKVVLARQEIMRMQELGSWNDKWLRHPISDMREPVKVICWLTNIDPVETDKQKREEQLDHYARLYLKASTTQVDRFFMQLRRGVTMAERGVHSAAADGRLWFGKNAYNPSVLAKLLEIFRVYFNYCEVGGDEKTPAMRLGLARGPVAEEDILQFAPMPVPRRRAAPRVSPPPKENPSQRRAGGALNQAQESLLATP
ncbi:hypothetical protein [Polaromonas sp.]|uniref:hypothetical protein n=1 Tax=Polaromonas sp. TaxID=1869339 RepID=UPI0013BC7F34|nr:hypothetical protein [Polaromonas sp.]NDP64919.1 hypothetical protein [Polaromonas sp.]